MVADSDFASTETMRPVNGYRLALVEVFVRWHAELERAATHTKPTIRARDKT
jgi:hypothetical protein